LRPPNAAPVLIQLGHRRYTTNFQGQRSKVKATGSKVTVTTYHNVSTVKRYMRAADRLSDFILFKDVVTKTDEDWRGRMGGLK